MWRCIANRGLCLASTTKKITTSGIYLQEREPCYLLRPHSVRRLLSRAIVRRISGNLVSQGHQISAHRAKTKHCPVMFIALVMSRRSIPQQRLSIGGKNPNHLYPTTARCILRRSPTTTYNATMRFAATLIRQSEIFILCSRTKPLPRRRCILDCTMFPVFEGLISPNISMTTD